MDAYQYFYDSNGKQVGYAATGTMEWDARGGHEHWHFKDFAAYRLLDASRHDAVPSNKEAFCIANTDAVDYTVPHANWQPSGTDLQTLCGTESSMAVRQALDVGAGDTYVQWLPGQSFDITDVPNGSYYIQIAANPDRRLYEASASNNLSQRLVMLGGKQGARTVRVPPRWHRRILSSWTVGWHAWLGRRGYAIVLKRFLRRQRRQVPHEPPADKRLVQQVM